MSDKVALLLQGHLVELEKHVPSHFRTPDIR